MDQLRARVGATFGSEDLGGQGIDDPGTAQPSLGHFDEPEAGGSRLSIDGRQDDPGDGRADLPGDDGVDTDLPGTDNIREGRVGGVMGGPRQSQGEGQGG
jgi:hypothetical protein